VRGGQNDRWKGKEGREGGGIRRRKGQQGVVCRQSPFLALNLRSGGHGSVSTIRTLPPGGKGSGEEKKEEREERKREREERGEKEEEPEREEMKGWRISCR